MKKLQYILSLFCVLAIMSACNDDETVKGEITISPSVISPFAESEWTLEKPKGDQDAYLYRLNWSKARFFYQSGDIVYVDDVVYEAEIDLVDNNFSKAVSIASTSKLYTDLYTLQMNDIMQQLIGEESDSPQMVNIRIKITANGSTAYSEALPLIITPYKLRSGNYIYIIGNMNDWDPSNKDYMMYRDNNDTESGVYTYTGYFAANTYFKFCAEKYLGGFNNMYYSTGTGTLALGESEEGAFYANDGYYTVTIDIVNMTWTLEPYDASAAKSYTTMGPIG